MPVTKNTTYKSYYKYRCSTYSNQGKNACSYHAILENELYAIVLSEVQKFSKIAFLYEDELLRKLIEINNKTKNKSNNLLEKQIRKIKRDLHGITLKVDVMIEQMVNGNISEQLFKKMMNQYELTQENLSHKLVELKSELSNMKDDIGNIQHLIDCFKQRLYIEKLDRETIIEIIDYIEVFKKEKIDGEYLQRVDIHFNFIGQISAENFQSLKEYVKNQEEKQAQVVQVV